MPVHDWTLVEADIFHVFHAAWLPVIQQALNTGLLPQGYYALTKQHVGRSTDDVLTLHASLTPEEPFALPPATGVIAVAEAPPRARSRQTIDAAAPLARRRTLAVRYVNVPLEATYREAYRGMPGFWREVLEGRRTAS